MCLFLQPQAPLDPTKELSRLISEQKYEEAFTVALHRNDVTIVSWLCSQVNSAIDFRKMPSPNCTEVESRQDFIPICLASEVFVANLGLVNCMHALSLIQRLNYMHL